MGFLEFAGLAKVEILYIKPVLKHENYVVVFFTLVNEVRKKEKVKSAKRRRGN